MSLELPVDLTNVNNTSLQCLHHYYAATVDRGSPQWPHRPTSPQWLLVITLKTFLFTKFYYV